MKKASIAVALVLVFGLFAAAFSLTPAIAQYGTSPSPSSTGNSTSTGSTAATGNTTTSSTGNATTSSNTTSTNATSTQGSTFSARGSIASMIFDTGTTVTNNTNETGTSSTNTTSMGNTTTGSTGNMTSSGNTTLSGNATGNTTLSQTIVGGDNSTGNTTGMTGTNTTTSSTGNTTTSSSGNATSTASQLDQPYILSGDWSLDVKDGTVSDFEANWTMVHIDGTGRHTHEVSNFQSANGSTVQLKQNGTTVIFGTADVLTNGSPKWTGVNAVITIDNMNVASISFASEETDDHFHGQPIYGPVYSLTENGNELIQAPGGTSTSGNATGGNMTGNATQGAQNALNQTGNAISNATEGIKDFFNGTG